MVQVSINLLNMPNLHITNDKINLLIEYLWGLDISI